MELLEIKAPKTLSSTVQPAWLVQISLQMACTDTETCTLLQFHPVNGKILHRVRRDRELEGLLIDLLAPIAKAAEQKPPEEATIPNMATDMRALLRQTLAEHGRLFVTRM